MAVKRAKVAAWSVGAARLGAEAICTGGWFGGVCWADAGRLVTLERTGQLARWGVSGVREQTLELGVRASWMIGLWRLDARRALARLGAALYVVEMSSLTVLHTLPDICDEHCGLAVSGAHVVAAWEWGVVAYAWEGDALRETSRLHEPLPVASRLMRVTYTLAAGGDVMAARYDDQLFVFELARGEARRVALERVLTLEADGARGLALRQGSLGVASMQTGAMEPQWREYHPSYEGGAQVAQGWALWGAREVTRLDGAGQRVWSWESAAELIGGALSPDGAHLAVWTTARVVVLDAATGAVQGAAGLEGRIDRMGFIDEPAQLVAMVQEQPYDYAQRTHRWGLDGAYLGASGWRHVTISDGALYGESYADKHKIQRQLERWRPSEPTQVLGPIEPILGSLCVAGGAALYDAYTGGGKWSWTLRRAADDGAGWQGRIIATRPKRPRMGPLVSAEGLVAATISAKEVEVYEAASGALRYSIKAGGRHGMRVLFSEDGGALLTLGDVKLHRWDMATGAARWEVKADKSYVGASALSRDGRYVVIASGWQPALKVYDVETGAEVSEVSLDTPAITAAASGPDGRLYLACVDTQLYAVEWARLVSASV